MLPGLLLGAIWSNTCMGGTPYPFGLLLGPFSMPLGMPTEHPEYSEPRMWAQAFLLVAMIAVHPIKPNRFTAWISGIGLFLWFLIGLAYLTDGV